MNQEFPCASRSMRQQSQGLRKSQECRPCPFCTSCPRMRRPLAGSQVLSRSVLKKAATMSRGYLCGLVLAAGSMLAAGVQAREKVELSAEDGKTAQMVASMVSSRHINHPPIDDALSEKLFQRYLEVWDPQKLYFCSPTSISSLLNRTSWTTEF